MSPELPVVSRQQEREGHRGHGLWTTDLRNSSSGEEVGYRACLRRSETAEHAPLSDQLDEELIGS